MNQTSGGFRAAVLAGWVLLSGAGLWYARFKGFPMWAALPALAAFLIEYPFYLAPAFRTVREQFAGLRLLVYVVASAVLPYLAACGGAAQFTWIGLGKLAAVALVLGAWYRVLPAWPVIDVLFLAAVVAVKIGRFATSAYAVRYKGLDIAVLGDLALFQIAVMSLMLVRRVPETGYGFWPTRKDWRIGGLHFLMFFPIGCALAIGMHAIQLAKPGPAVLGKVAVGFLGWLFVLSLGEEFIFRGVLQGWLEKWTRSRQGALVVTSVLFGGVHLWFGKFPNWKWVLIAGLMGWFCGRARNQAGSIRAGMVTHTLVITAWRAFFVGV